MPLDGADLTNRLLDESFRLCDAGSCVFGPGASQRFATLAARLKATPVAMTMPGGNVTEANYAFLIMSSLAALYKVADWPDSAGLLADLERSVGATSAGELPAV